MAEPLTYQKIQQMDPEQAQQILRSMPTDQLMALKNESAKPAQSPEDKLRSMPTEELMKLKQLSPAEQQRVIGGGVPEQKQGIDWTGTLGGLAKSAINVVNPGTLFTEKGREETLGGFLGGMRAVESVTGAPTREAIREAQAGGSAYEGFTGQFGKAPEQAATGKDIAAAAGLSSEPAFNLPVIGGVSPAGAAGVGVDIIADPTTFIGLGTGKAIKGVGTKIASRVPFKKNAEAIIEAAARRGVKPTPGQLYDSQLVGKLEGSLLQSEGKIGGSSLRRNVKKNVETLQSEVDNILRSSSSKDTAEIAADARDQISKVVSQKLDQASTLYDDFTTKFADEAADTSAINAEIENLIEDFSGTPEVNEVLKWRASVNSKDAGLNTIANLKRFRTSVGKLSKSPDAAKREIAGRLYEAATKARSDSLKRAIGDGGEEIIGAADQAYREAAELVKTVTKKDVKGGVKTALNNWVEKAENEGSSMVETMLRTASPERLQKLKGAFPEAFETLRQGKIANLARKITGPKGKLSPGRFGKAVDEMPKETAELLLGPDAKAKAADIKILMEEMPELFNPSKSGEILEFFKMFNVASQATSVGRSGMLKLITSGEKIKNLGTGISGFALPAGAAQQVGKTFIPNEQSPSFGIPGE